jgi:hypothetical protein
VADLPLAFSRSTRFVSFAWRAIRMSLDMEEVVDLHRLLGLPHDEGGRSEEGLESAPIAVDDGLAEGLLHLGV